MKFSDWFEKKRVDEATRYSVEVNYRTKTKEVLEGFAKIALGYASAGLKKRGYHVKQVFDHGPIRIMVSSRNWDDGEWVGMASYSSREDGGCFVMSKGFYNKDRRTISIQSSRKCENDTPAEMVKELVNMMHGLKDSPDRRTEKLKPVKRKTGPKG